MSDLDERENGIDAMLRASGPRLRTAVSHAPVAPFHRRRPMVRSSWAVAVATVVVLVAGLVAIGTNRNDQSPGNGPGRLHWLVTDLPAGLPLVAMIDPQNQAGSTVTAANINVYATDAAPLGPIVSVRGSMGVPELDVVPAGEGTNFRETTIGGRRAAFADGQSGQRILYIEVDGHWVALRSRNLDDTKLGRMAQTVVRSDDGAAAIPTADLVDGLTLVLPADAPLTELIGGSDSARADYANSDGRSLGLRISVPRPADRALAGLETALAPTKVGGASGFIGSYVDGSSIPPHRVEVLSWQRDGLSFKISAVGLTNVEIIAAANSVNPASDQKWNDLLQRTGYALDSGDAPAGTVPAVPAPPDTVPPFTGRAHDVAIEVSVADPSPGEQIWSGTLPTGETWEVDVTHVYGSMWMRPQVNGLGQGATSGSIPRPAGQEFSCCNPLNVVTANAKAVALRVTRSNGDRYTIPLHDLPGTDGLRIALIALPDGTQLSELIDADGNVLESMP